MAGPDHAADETDFVTVHPLGRRTTPAPTATGPETGPQDWTLGPVRVTGETVEGASGAGLRVTAALPIAALPGLDAVADLSGGREGTTAGGAVAAAAITAGFRLHF